MKDKFYYLLFKLSSNDLIRSILFLYYKIAIFVVRITIQRYDFVNHAYLKGSFGKEYFVPVISDLDFFIIGEKSVYNYNKVKRTFKLIHIFFPMVSDFDFHSETEAKLLFNFSGAKFFPTTKWMTLKGNDVDFTYRFNPRKYYIDIIQEIFFQFEWLFKNLKDRTKDTRYNTVCIQRQYMKVEDLVEYLVKFDDSFNMQKSVFKEDERWHLYDNERIVLKFNELIEKNIRLKELLEIFESEFENYDLESIFQLQYYKDELELISENYSYTKRYLNLSLQNFKLFYYTGCIDSYLLYEWSKKTNDLVTKKYIELSYFVKLLESRKCSVNNHSFYLNNLSHVLMLQDTIIENFRSEKLAPSNFINKNIILIDVKRFENIAYHRYLQMLNKEWTVLGVGLTKSGVEFRSTIKSFLITRDDQFDEISNTDHLLLLMAKWCFGAKNILILGEELLLGKEDFNSIPILNEYQTDKIIRLCDYDPVFAFMTSWQMWKKIDSFDYSNMSLKSEFYIPLQLSSIVPNEQNSSEFLELVDFKKGLDYTIVDVQIGLRKKNDSSFDKYIGYLPIMRSFLEINDIGLLKLKENYQQNWNVMQNLIDSDLDPYDELKQIDSFLKQDVMLYVNSNEDWSLWGNAKIISTSSDKIEFFTGKKCNRVVLKFKNLNQRTGIHEFQAKFIGEIQDELAMLSFETDSYYEKPDIEKFKEAQLYNMKFLVNILSNKYNGIKIELNVQPQKNYQFVFDEIKPILEDDLNFEYFKKIENINDGNLGEFYQGFYKIVLNLSNDQSLKAQLVDEENELYFQQYNTNTNQLVINHFVQNNSTKLKIQLDAENSLNSIKTIDILKVN